MSPVGEMLASLIHERDVAPPAFGLGAPLEAKRGSGVPSDEIGGE